MAPPATPTPPTLRTHAPHAYRISAQITRTHGQTKYKRKKKQRAKNKNKIRGNIKWAERRRGKIFVRAKNKNGILTGINSRVAPHTHTHTHKREKFNNKETHTHTDTNIETEKTQRYWRNLWHVNMAIGRVLIFISMFITYTQRYANCLFTLGRNHSALFSHSIIYNLWSKLVLGSDFGSFFQLPGLAKSPLNEGTKEGGEGRSCSSRTTAVYQKSKVSTDFWLKLDAADITHSGNGLGNCKPLANLPSPSSPALSLLCHDRALKLLLGENFDSPTKRGIMTTPRSAGSMICICSAH